MMDISPYLEASLFLSGCIVGVGIRRFYHASIQQSRRLRLLKLGMSLRVLAAQGKINEKSISYKTLDALLDHSASNVDGLTIWWHFKNRTEVDRKSAEHEKARTKFVSEMNSAHEDVQKLALEFIFTERQIVMSNSLCLVFVMFCLHHGFKPIALFFNLVKPMLASKKSATKYEAYTFYESFERSIGSPCRA